MGFALVEPFVSGIERGDGDVQDFHFTQGTMAATGFDHDGRERAHGDALTIQFHFTSAFEDDIDLGHSFVIMNGRIFFDFDLMDAGDVIFRRDKAATGGAARAGLRRQFVELGDEEVGHFILGQRPLVNASVARSDEATEKRVGSVGLAEEFRMKLTSHEERVVFEFDDLDQFGVCGRAAEDHTCFFKLRAVGVVEFVAVTVALVNQEGAIKVCRFCSDRELARLRAKPHRAAFFDDIPLSV
jgi:hypothetical protein